MGIFSAIFGAHSSSKSKSTSERDPWEPVIPYLTEALGTGKQVFDQFSNLSPEELAARGGRIDQLMGRENDPIYGQSKTAASDLLGGAYNPDIHAAGPIGNTSITGPAPVAGGQQGAPLASSGQPQPSVFRRMMSNAAAQGGASPETVAAYRGGGDNVFQQLATDTFKRKADKANGGPAGTSPMAGGARIPSDGARSGQFADAVASGPFARTMGPAAAASAAMRAPAAAAPDPTVINSTAARAAQGPLDPSAAQARLLSGQVDNPQLAAMADAATRQGERKFGDAVQDSTEALTRSVLPAIRSGAVSSGGYGGSRQGIAEGLAMSDSNKNLTRAARDLGIAGTDATADLYGKAYESAQDRMASAADSIDARAHDVAKVNVGNYLDTSKFNAGLEQDTSKFNATLGQDTSKFNANLGLQNNAQELTRAQVQPGIFKAGVDLYNTTTNGEDTDYGSLMDALGLPRTTKQGAFQSYLSGLNGTAAQGGQTSGASSSKSVSSPSPFDAAMKVAALFAA